MQRIKEQDTTLETYFQQRSKLNGTVNTLIQLHKKNRCHQGINEWGLNLTSARDNKVEILLKNEKDPPP